MIVFCICNKCTVETVESMKLITLHPVIGVSVPEMMIATVILRKNRRWHKNKQKMKTLTSKTEMQLNASKAVRETLRC